MVLRAGFGACVTTFALATAGVAQTPASRIVEPIDESQRVDMNGQP